MRHYLTLETEKYFTQANKPSFWRLWMAPAIQHFLTFALWVVLIGVVYYVAGAMPNWLKYLTDVMELQMLRSF